MKYLASAALHMYAHGALSWLRVADLASLERDAHEYLPVPVSTSAEFQDFVGTVSDSPKESGSVNKKLCCVVP
jgi:hypothetical protein